MLKAYLLHAITLLLLLTASLGVHASAAFRCGNGLVERGMTKNEVLDMCGPPSSTDRDDSVWIYDNSTTQFARRITLCKVKLSLSTFRKKQTLRAKIAQNP